MPSIDLSRYQPKPKQLKNRPAGKSMSDFFSQDISFGRSQLSDKKKESMYLELSSLLQAGVDFKSSFDLITADQKNKNDKLLFRKIQDSVVGGMSFSEALNQTERFSLYEVYSLQIGEETGKINEVLKDLARYYQSKIKHQRKIIAALTYPLVVLSTSVGAVFFMLKFVVPMFGDVFLRFGGELPWITAQIISFSSWIGRHFWGSMILLLLSAATLYLFRKTETSRSLFSSLILRTPVVGQIVRKIYLARFCNSMRLLINAHIPLLRAISLIRQMINYYPIEFSLKIVEDEILRGKSLHQSLQQFKVYPSKMIMLLKIGEETNQLDYFFGQISEQYVEEVEYKTSTISSLMEPLIIIFLGLIVGLILVSMYLPLFQMSSRF